MKLRLMTSLATQVWLSTHKQLKLLLDYTDDYWSGYFTSHPAFKRHVRTSSGFFHAARLINALASNDETVADQYLTPLWHAMGVVQVIKNGNLN